MTIALVTVAVAGSVGLVLAARTRRRLPADRGDRAVAVPRARPEDLPESLVRCERAVAGGRRTAADLHRALRPLLRTAAAGRLARRDVPQDGPATRAALGERAWDVVRPDRPPPPDRLAAGLSVTELTEILDAIEAL